MKPGEVAVQCGDVRGEAAADIADNLANGLQGLAKALGYGGGGRVVGLTIVQWEARADGLGKVTVELQIVAGGGSMDDIDQKTRANGGVLQVRRYRLPDLDIVKVVSCFKRLEIGLFTSAVSATELELAEETAQRSSSSGTVQCRPGKVGDSRD